MLDKLVSRKRECEELQRCLESDRSEFVIISGRRRIGKTYLIDKFFNYKYDFTFVGEHKTPATVQIQNFMRAIKAVYTPESPAIFTCLRLTCGKRKNICDNVIVNGTDTSSCNVI